MRKYNQVERNHDEDWLIDAEMLKAIMFLLGGWI